MNDLLTHCGKEPITKQKAKRASTAKPKKKATNTDTRKTGRDNETSAIASSSKSIQSLDVANLSPDSTETSAVASSSNPVQSLGIMNLSPDSFEGCRITPDGKISVIDAIMQFRGISKEKSQDVYNKEVSNKNATLPKYKFSGQGARETPVAAFSELLQILSQLPGEAAKKLRAEQAEITSRAAAGDVELEEAISERRETVDPRVAELAMVGIPERRKLDRSSASMPGLYLIEVGTIGEIKADPLALPKRRKDILKLPVEMDDHIQYKFGFSKHLDTRMVQHSDNELKNTSVVQTWSWPANTGMLVSGENHIRDTVKDLGGKLLPHTTDWAVMPPRYEEVVGDIVADKVHMYLIDNDPYILMKNSETLHIAEREADSVRHQFELIAEKKQLEVEKTRYEAQIKVKNAQFEAQLSQMKVEKAQFEARLEAQLSQMKVEKMQLEMDKMRLEMGKMQLEMENSDLKHENEKHRYSIAQ